MRQENNKPKTVDGVEKSGYEWTQNLRKLETEARKEKEIINSLKAMGDEEGARQHRRKLRAINEKYGNICDQIGLTPQKERMRVYGGTKNIAKKVDNGVKSGILKEVSLNAIEITQETIDNVPFVNISELGENNSFTLQRLHKEVLRFAQNQPLNTEIGLICDLYGNILDIQIGKSGAGNVTIPSIFEPHISIHNHPDGLIFSHTDIRHFIFSGELKIMSVIGNDGKVFCLSKTNNYDGFEVFQLYNNLEQEISAHIKNKDVEKYIESIEKFIKETENYGVKFNK